MEIKVLWIDDQEFDHLETLAERKGIDLTHVYSWEEAEPYLTDWHYDQWSAIIFDCFCSFERGGIEDKKFLRKAFRELDKISGTRFIPWYVLSAGSGERFDNIIDNQLTEERELWDKEWKKIYYSKDTDTNDLLTNIVTMAQNLYNYKIRYRFHDFFTALNTEINGLKVFAEDLEGIMYPLLKQISYPQQNGVFNPLHQYNQLRQAIEWFFRSCNSFGLLPDVLIDEKTGVNLSYSVHYLGGKPAGNLGIRYGQDDDRILPSNMFYALKNILDVTNEKSHTKQYDDDVQKFFAEVGSEYVLLSMTLRFVSLIIWYVKYLENGHFNKEENLAMCVNLSDNKGQCIQDDYDIDYYKQGEFTIDIDEDGNRHCEGCILPPKTPSNYIGKSVTLDNIKINNDSKTKAIYPFFAKFIPVLMVPKQ